MMSAQGGSDAISLQYFQPAAELRPYISAYYIFRADLPFVRDLLRADLAQIRFMISGEGVYSFNGGDPRSTPDVALLGPTMSATRFDVIGPLYVLGVALLPAGWAALIRDDASDHADGVEDGAAVLGPLVEETLDALRHAPNVEQRIKIVDCVMRALLGRAANPPFWFTRLADKWLVGDLSPRVDDLVAGSGLSARQVERLARRIYGGPPKLLARKYRALRVASMMSANDSDWGDAVGEAFYDQSHFIRDFKRFAGMTPNQFLTRPTPVLRLTTDRRLLTGRLPALALVS